MVSTSVRVATCEPSRSLERVARVAPQRQLAIRERLAHGRPVFGHQGQGQVGSVRATDSDDARAGPRSRRVGTCSPLARQPGCLVAV
jgi:hypothetical protein